MAATPELCAVIPDFDGCEAFREPEPVPEPKPDEGGKMEGGDMDKKDDMEMDPAMGQLVWTVVALSNAAGWSMDAFRYRNLFNDDFYSDSNADNGLYRIAQQILHLTAVSFWGIVSLTQLLTYLGSAVELNLMAWGYGSMILGLAYIVSAGLAYYSYEKTWAADEAYAATIRSQLNEQAVGSVSTDFSLAMEYGNWMAYQWEALGEDAKKEMKDGEKAPEPMELFNYYF